jgi:hypothetical protein
MKKIYLILICCANPAFFSCQEEKPVTVTGNVEGTVTDFKTHQMLSDAVVEIISNANTTFITQSRQTDDNGHFNFTDIEEGNYKLSVTKSGYIANSQDVKVIAGQTISSDIALMTDPDFEIENGVLTNYYGKGGNVVIPVGVTSIGKGAFKTNTSLVSVVIPDGVTIIGNEAFQDCSKLTSVTIPNTVVYIGTYAFRSCSSLFSVTIPNSVTTIGNHAFFLCTALYSATIGSGVTSIGEGAFLTFDNLRNITVNWTIPLVVPSIFAPTYMGLITLHVPTGTKAAYQAATVWGDFGEIVEY